MHNFLLADMITWTPADKALMMHVQALRFSFLKLSGCSVLTLVSSPVLRSDNVIEDIQDKLQDVRNPTAAMMVLLREMDLESDAELGREGPLAPGRGRGCRR